MALPTPKELKKLADTCRKAGIRTFKCGDIEFTLDDAPPAQKRPKKAAESASESNTIESDGLTDEELLFWSVGASSEPGETTQ